MSSIKTLNLKQYMLFDDIKFDFCSGINVISGGNSTGKTAILKTLYSSIKSTENSYKQRITTNDLKEQVYVDKFKGVFCPDDDIIGRLVKRCRGSNKAEIKITFSNKKNIQVSFTNKQKNHMDIHKIDLSKDDMDISSVYIPPKEIISSTENFGALYREYHINFEETYYDLCLLLEKPVKRGKYTKKQEAVLEDFLSLVNGKVIQRDKKFYLKVDGSGEFEMGLLSEGYKKIATLIYLIQNDSLKQNSILFWDEPETNMNPKMIWPVVTALYKLASLGVQIFISTHSYFIQQAINIQSHENSVKNRFFSLYYNDNQISVESAEELGELAHNDIMEEFDAIYDREQMMFYDD